MLTEDHPDARPAKPWGRSRTGGAVLVIALTVTLSGCGPGRPSQAELARAQQESQERVQALHDALQEQFQVGTGAGAWRVAPLSGTGQQCQEGVQDGKRSDPFELRCSLRRLVLVEPAGNGTDLTAVKAALDAMGAREVAPGTGLLPTVPAEDRPAVSGSYELRVRPQLKVEAVVLRPGRGGRELVLLQPETDLVDAAAPRSRRNRR